MRDKGKKNNVYLKFFKRLLLGILIFFTLITAAAVIISAFYGDKVKDYVISKLNKQLNTELNVDNIELSVFKRFPYVSVIFSDITAKDAVKNTKSGNLLEAKRLYFQFRVWDLFSGNYRIRKIELSDAKIKMKVYEDGSDNFHFWKEAKGGKENDFSFYLQKVVLSNVSFSYNDLRSKQDYYIKANDLILNGRFAEKEYNLTATGDCFINKLASGEILYLNNKNVALRINLHVNNNTGKFDINEGTLKFGNMAFNIKGNWISNDDAQTVDLKISGEDIDLEDFLNEVPSVFRKYIINYEGKGKFNATCIIKGSIKGNSSPLVELNAVLQNGHLEQKSTSVSLGNLSLSVKFTNGNKRNTESSSIIISGLKGNLNEGNFNGNIKITNLNRPDISLDMQANLGLKDLEKFLKIDTIEDIDGKININVAFHGQPANPGKFTAKDFIESDVKGEVIISGCNVSLKSSRQKYQNVNGTFNFNNNDIEVKDLKGNVVTEEYSGKNSVNDFMIKGTFTNVLPFLFLPDQKLKINADLKSGNIELDKLFLASVPEGSSKTEKYNFELPDNISFDFNFDINDFSFNKFKASRVTGKISMYDKRIKIEDGRLNTMDGKVLASGLIDAGRKDKILLSCDATLEKVNIKKMFYQFSNFGQESMKDENLQGIINADIQFAAICNEALNIDMNSVYVKSALKIENGRLLSYKPVEGLSSYIKGRDLSDIKFSTLTNQIEISNRNIFIPSMEVNSNALNLKVWGKHNFDNEIEYHINISLSDLKDPSKKAKKEDEFGPVEDDGLNQGNYFFLITGTVDNPIYHRIDKQAYKEKLAGDIKKEKENLKNIIAKEFGWLKKDTTGGKNTKNSGQSEKEEFKKKEGSGFIYEWEDD